MPPVSRSLWQRPQLRQINEDSEERSATWLELFYDLVFVAAIGQLAHHLSSHLDGLGFAGFALMFIPLWWCWVGTTFYATRFDTDTLFDRLFTFFQMGIITAMAVNAHHGLAAGAMGFALCYALSRSLLIGQYQVAGYFIPRARALANWYSVGFGSSAALWLSSIWIPAPWRYALWSAGLLIDFATPLMAGHVVVKVPPSMSHVPERIGLFTIIVLGEAIIGVVNGLAELTWTPFAELTALMGLAIACSLWWLYFDSSDGSPLRSMQKGNVGTALTWLYLHLPLTASLTMAGVGLEKLLENGPAEQPATIERWLFCGAIAVALIALASIHWLTCTLGTPKFRRVLSSYRLTSASALLLVAVWGDNLTSFWLVSIAALACMVQVVLDLLRQRQPATKSLQ
ncbi:MAG: low temperature requirement protein A [Leptolyngbyaceae cyanobacterium]